MEINFRYAATYIISRLGAKFCTKLVYGSIYMIYFVFMVFLSYWFL
jgi:hypothetical protein